MKEKYWYDYPLAYFLFIGFFWLGYMPNNIVRGIRFIRSKQ